MRNIFFSLVLGLSLISFKANASDDGSSAKAFIVEHLNNVHNVNSNDVTVNGPIASINSMASIGYHVSDLSYKIQGDYCLIGVKMIGSGLQDKMYTFYLENDKNLLNTTSSKLLLDTCQRKVK